MACARPSSVLKQAMLCMALGVLSTLLWFIAPLVHSRSSHALALWMTLFFLTSSGTMIASVWIGYDLRDGVESERWPPEEIERFRSTFDNPLVRGAYLTLTLSVLGFFLYALLSRHHFRGSGLGLFVLSQTLSQILIAARRPELGIPVGQIDWSAAPRITSDHWGQGT
jgi:hypothetical protein